MSNVTLRYADLVIRWKWAFLIGSVLLAMAGLYGAKNLTFSNSYRVFFDDNNPELIALDKIEDTYVKIDTVAFVLRGAEGDIFSVDRLQLILDLTEQAWQIPYVLRADSLTNYQYTWASDDDLVVRDLVDGPARLTAESIEEIKSIAMSEPTVVNRLISPDGATATIILTLQFPDGDTDALPTVAGEVRALRDRLTAEHEDVRIALTGGVMLATAFNESSKKDLGTLFPLMGVFLAITMYLFLGSVGGSLIGMTLVFLAAGASMGISGYMGYQVTSASGIAPVIILTIAIADSIHILVTVFAEIAGGRTRLEAMRESLRINMQPVMLTSITTAIGFLSLNFSEAPPFRDLGNICAIGAIIAFILSVTFLPAAVAIIPIKGRRRGTMETLALSKITDLVTAHPGRVVIGMIIIGVVLSMFLPQLKINDRFVEQFAQGTEFRDDSDFVSEHLPGVYLMDFSIGSGEEGGISDPAYLRHLQAFSDWLNEQPGVVHVFTITDIVKQLNKSMHGDDPDWYRLPEERDLAAQYLLLYEMSLPYGLDLNNQIDISKEATRVMTILDAISSQDVKDLKWRAEGWLRDNTPEPMHGVGSGVTVIFSFLTSRNVKAMFLGTALALLMISASLFISLRNLKAGLISLVPNLAPPLFAFGLWAIISGEVGLWAAAVTATSLGMIVDFTVHFLSKYLRGRRERGLDADESVRYAFNMVGAALWISAFVLIAGFSALMMSDFKVNAYLGLVTAMIILIALITDFLLLPALLLLIDRKKGYKAPVKSA